MAKLFFRYGAMNSGKSTALIQVAHNYEERDMSIIIVKPSVDTKGQDTIVSRLGVQRKVDVLLNKEDDIQQLVREKHPRVDCILVDEVQFLTPEQVDQLFYLVVVDGIPVICYGLRTDFLLNGFPGSERLLLLAHSIEELKTICRCGKKAVCNGRTINGRFVFEGEQVLIDGEEKIGYESLCGECYMKHRGENRE